jgi:hypothetical protein
MIPNAPLLTLMVAMLVVAAGRTGWRAAIFR